MVYHHIFLLKSGSLTLFAFLSTSEDNQRNTDLNAVHMPKNAIFFSFGSIMKPAAHVWINIIKIRVSSIFCANTILLHSVCEGDEEGRKGEVRAVDQLLCPSWGLNLK